MIIHVLDRHIADGVQCSTIECPIARAIKESIGIEVDVFPERIYAREGALLAELPIEVTRAVVAFDTTGRLEPFSFELDVARLAIPRMEAR